MKAKQKKKKKRNIRYNRKKNIYNKQIQMKNKVQILEEPRKKKGNRR